MLLPLFFVLVATAFSEPLEEVPDAKEGWLQVCCRVNDANDDGAISFREFTPFTLEILDLNRKELEQIFLTADVDKNSDLDGSECPIVRKLIRQKMQEKVKQAMQEFDENKDGLLSSEEVRRLALKQFGLSGDDAAEVYLNVDEFNSRNLKEYQVVDVLLGLREKAVAASGHKIAIWDTNGNKNISYEELRAALGSSVDRATLKKAFKRIDYNKDYHVSAREYLAFERELAELKQETTVSPPVTDAHRIRPRRHATRDAPDDNQTAPPPLEVTTEIDIERALDIVLQNPHNQAGGFRAPSIDDSVVVPFDDPDFQ